MIKQTLKTCYTFFKLYFEFQLSFLRFKKLSQKEGRLFRVRWKERVPHYLDRISTTSFDRHYIFHPAWAARVVQRINPKKHVDFGSTLHFATLVSAFVPVDFYDIRPAALDLSNLSSKKVDLTQGFSSDTLFDSVSCMHVLEHIGLGRYGDTLDSEGDLKAISTLKKQVAPGGNLLIVVPIASHGRINFNAHRVYAPEMMPAYFSPEFKLKEFVLIPDQPKDGDLVINPPESLLKTQNYGCGCYWFVRSK